VIVPGCRYAAIGVTAPTPAPATRPRSTLQPGRREPHRAANPADFTPSLDALDALVQSLQIGDTAP
jgi:hypothetical protein